MKIILILLAFLCMCRIAVAQCPPDTFVVYDPNNLLYIAVNQPGPSFCPRACDGTSAFHKVARIRMDSVINTFSLSTITGSSHNYRLMITDTGCTYTLYDTCMIGSLSHLVLPLVTGRRFNVIIESELQVSYLLFINYAFNPYVFSTLCGPSTSVDEPVRPCKGGHDNGYTDMLGRWTATKPKGVMVYDHEHEAWTIQN